MDNGPIAKVGVFQTRHGAASACDHARICRPARMVGGRPRASKGKVERPFRTVKEAHETLYHFHQPENEAEANLWLRRYLVRYNAQQHRSEPHSRIEDWLRHLPDDGVREMCAWERFCAFAREPERRKVGVDARISVDGAAYEVDAELAGETVVLWWGLFDQELYVEHGDERFGPYAPVGGPIPLHRYRQIQESGRGARRPGGRPRRQASGCRGRRWTAARPGARPAAAPPPAGAVRRSRPVPELVFPDRIAAKHAIADELGMPLARLPPEDRAFIDALVARDAGPVGAGPGAGRLRNRRKGAVMLTEVMEHSGSPATCWAPATTRPSITASSKGRARRHPRR